MTTEPETETETEQLFVLPPSEEVVVEKADKVEEEEEQVLSSETGESSPDVRPVRIDKFGKFQPGSLVTYKLGKTAPWPAVVLRDDQIPHEVLARRPKKAIRNIVIQFFQSRDFYWVAAAQLVPLDYEVSQRMTSGKNTKANKRLAQAYREAVEYMVKRELDDSDGEEEDGAVEEERTVSNVMTIDSLLSPRLIDNKRKRSPEADDYFDENISRSKMAKTDNPPLTPLTPLTPPTGDHTSIKPSDLSSQVYDEEEEVEYETIAVRALECIKTRVFEPIVRAREFALGVRGGDKKKKSKKNSIVVQDGPVVLDAEDTSELAEHMVKLRHLVPRRNATDATNIMKLVDNYKLIKILTELRNHAIRGEVVLGVADGRLEPDLAERADILVKHWWAALNVPGWQ